MDRIEGLVESQVSRFRTGASEWLVLPWTNGFYLFSEDSEGQRRGREVVVAFLGPGVVSVDTVTESRLNAELPPAWKSTGLVRASFLRRVDHRPNGAAEMLARLEDMVASVGGRQWTALEIKPTNSELLRDFRLALLRRDDDSARSLLDQIVLNGHVSAENLRYLRIEYFAAFGRWAEMRAMPYISALLQTRRPRAISETLLRMVWWTELSGPEHENPRIAFNERGVLGEFGPLVRSVRVPSTPEGRGVCFLAALADEDVEWQTSILERAEEPEERHRLKALASAPEREATATPADLPGHAPVLVPVADPVAEAFREGRLADVVSTFITDPTARYAELALQAILDSGEVEHAPRVLAAVRDLGKRGALELTRHGRRDLAELEQFVDASCADWVEWAKRLAGDVRWADAAAVARNNAEAWPQLGTLDAQQLAAVCDALLEASGGTNADQLRACIDLLCRESARILAGGSSNDFCQVVLALLSEQDNFSEMVRSAYLDLFAAWLEVGPSAGEYEEVLDLTLKIWQRIASPNAVGWCINVLELVADSPCPVDSKRTGLAVLMIDGARLHSGRLSFRERVEVEVLAAGLGLPSQEIEAPKIERDVWSALDGKLVGIYSLLPRVETHLRARLAKLCSVGDVKENHDEVATQALKSLAERADYFIVDTWHAAHQATGAIDAVRPREKQILPRLKGHSGFLRALEEALGG
ncbi:protein DpdD [Nocardioides pelophilus]|uniref:protein DpdD n=1 Tax=Nocardioides pelophilus TaxID=2172019 RepID=UPI0016010254|nr:protein DpdD [Nocardioides pelophilus]